MIGPPGIRLTSSKFTYDYSMKGTFGDKETVLIKTNLERFFDLTGLHLAGSLLARNLEIVLDHQGGNNFQAPRLVHLNPNLLTDWTVTHELAHALDGSQNWQLSQRMRKLTGSGFPFRPLHAWQPAWKLFWYRVGSPPPPCGVDKNFNSLEDFAEAVTAYIFPDIAHKKAEQRGYPYERWGYAHFHDTPRGRFIASLIQFENQMTPSI